MAEDPFVTSTAQTTQPHIYRPIPRRNFSTHTESSDSPSGDASSSSYYYQNTPPPAAPSSEANSRPSDFLAQLNARLLRTYNARDAEGDAPAGPGAPPPRNKSLLNMTSSTLYGIYDDVGSATADERSVAQTPWGTGAETPAHSGMGLVGGSIDTGNTSTSIAGGKSSSARRRGAPGTLQQQHHHHHHHHEGLSQRRGSKVQARRRPARRGASKYAVILGKLAALFTFGVAYGVVVSHLHERRELAAVRVEAVDRGSWVYLAAWGFAGMGLGSLLPYVDLLWDGEGCEGPEPEAEKETSFTEQWNEVVRSVGAFMGIAFAIRRLPWQSTLQLTLTLALVNPALWYILDRSKPGLSFSLIVTSVVTSFIFLSNPDVLPSPSLPATSNSTHYPSASSSAAAAAAAAATAADQELFAGVVSYESLAVVTWVGSVLFCSCVCFGSIGRRLAVLDAKRG
ncbi:hypothetical protein BS50DRAFT_497131 [Corynespora cassiicola Philippines]|uniref:INSIG domain-containing protein n=1 Tax=Corynespora cassiicola Philippines TaxID=1448308 RepID=A0A2T2NJN5_CORCC|nr:hypothetical protein BS50DRAFT_497131 [Corynespora cassiicola Philippines]